jgi:hypothetical protein
MINLKVGSLIKLVGSKYDDIQYVPVVNSTTKQYVRMPIGGVGMILKINNAGHISPEHRDLVFLYEDQIYETYHTFVELL